MSKQELREGLSGRRSRTLTKRQRRLKPYRCVVALAAGDDGSQEGGIARGGSQERFGKPQSISDPRMVDAERISSIGVSAIWIPGEKQFG